MLCPKCGFEQDNAVECSRCGVIFAKIHGSSEPDSMPADAGLKFAALRSTQSAGRDMNGKLILLSLLLVLGFLCHRLWINRELKYPPGVLVGSEPLQIMLRNPASWQKNKRTIVPLARYNLKARVLSKEAYHLDYGADISPIDLALGWGIMSDQKILDQLEITQDHRWFSIFPIAEKLSFPMDVLLAHSSNNHILPASAQIEKKVRGLRVGELVKLGGYLVGVREKGKWVWVSSLSRTDAGGGACEVFWVDQVESLPRGSER